MSSTLLEVPQSASRLVAISGVFTDDNPDATTSTSELTPTVMIDMQTMDLIEFEVTVEDLMKCLTEVKSDSNRLSILHYFLVHESDLDYIEEVILTHDTRGETCGLKSILFFRYCQFYLKNRRI